MVQKRHTYQSFCDMSPDIELMDFDQFRPNSVERETSSSFNAGNILHYLSDTPARSMKDTDMDSSQNTFTLTSNPVENLDPRKHQPNNQPNDQTDNNDQTNNQIKLDEPYRDENPDYYVYQDIKMGDGTFYQIKKGSVNYDVVNRMNQTAYRKMVQIFIELRNALNYTSKEPHMFKMIELMDGVNYLQQDYYDRFKFHFGYTFNPFKLKNTIKRYNTFAILARQRKKNIGFYSPKIEFEYVPMELPSSSPLPQDKHLPVADCVEYHPECDLTTYMDFISDSVEFTEPKHKIAHYTRTPIITNSTVSRPKPQRTHRGRSRTRLARIDDM